MPPPVMLKCRGESAAGEPCNLKRACARWYIRENPAGWLDAPEIRAGGCLDFLAFGGQQSAVSLESAA